VCEFRRFIDSAQALVLCDAARLSLESIVALADSLPKRPTPVELLVEKDVFARLLVRATKERVCSNCGVVPLLFDLFSAGVDPDRVLLAVREAARGQRDESSAASPIHAAVSRALRIITTRFADRSLTLTTLARATGFSRWHLNQLLVEHASQGFLFHLPAARMNAAAHILRDLSSSVKEVAFRVGYRSPSQLDRHLRATLAVAAGPHIY